MSKQQNRNNSKSNKSKTQKDEFKFDSRQTKFIGKRSGKIFQSMDPSKSKNGILTIQTSYSQSSQEQQVRKNNKQQQTPFLITQKKQGNNTENKEQKQKDQQQSQQSQQSSNELYKPVKLKQVYAGTSKQAKETQKVQEKDKRENNHKQYDGKSQIISKKKSSPSVSKMHTYQKNKDEDYQYQFVFEQKEDSFKRNRQQDYLNQSLTNIQISEECTKEYLPKVSNNSKKVDKISNIKEVQKEAQNPIQQINKPKSQIQSKNIVQMQKNTKFQKQKNQDKVIKKKLALKSAKNEFINNSSQENSNHKKERKDKLISKILKIQIQKSDQILSESIHINTQKKLTGQIIFRPKTKVYFQGFSNKFTQVIINQVGGKGYQRQVKQAIFLSYLGSKMDLMTKIVLQSQIPFEVENASKDKYIKLNFTFTKDQSYSFMLK